MPGCELFVMEGKQKENTLGEWSDDDDDWVWVVDENTLGEWSDLTMMKSSVILKKMFKSVVVENVK